MYYWIRHTGALSNYFYLGRVNICATSSSVFKSTLRSHPRAGGSKVTSTNYSLFKQTWQKWVPRPTPLAADAYVRRKKF